MSISLVFPMYNEIEYLPMAIDRAETVLKKITFNYEIIIVNDASTDGSGQMADDIARDDDKIKVIHHRKNKKLGGALKTGFSNAIKDIIIYSDIDLPFDLSILKDIIPLASEFDIIKGYRIGSRESLLRTIYSNVYNLLVNFIFNLKIKDINFAMKIFKKEVLDNIELKSEGSFINVEFLAKAKRLGYSIKEIGVEYRPRTYGLSRLYSLDVIFKIIFEMIKFYPGIKLFSKRKVRYNKLKILYKRTSFKTKIYNFIRFKTCPFDAIERIIPKEGNIIDLGCGTGLFLNLLKLDSDKRILFGFDKDKRKIKVAMASLNGSQDIKFEQMDISSNFNLPKAECITLIDVLCYLNFNHKRELLKKCFKVLDLNGTLVIKDIDKALTTKFLWTFLQEFLIVKILRFTSVKGLYFENREKCLSLLREIGFIAEIFDLSREYLYPHILYVCRK